MARDGAGSPLSMRRQCAVLSDVVQDLRRQRAFAVPIDLKGFLECLAEKELFERETGRAIWTREIRGWFAAMRCHVFLQLLGLRAGACALDINAVGNDIEPLFNLWQRRARILRV